jgi:hypothetical protein
MSFRGFQFPHISVILRSWDARVTATSGSIFVVVVDPDIAMTQVSSLLRMTKREGTYSQATRIESPCNVFALYKI